MKRTLNEKDDMSSLVVKDNVLINASYNLELVEQRLVLLAIIEARETGKGINANNPLTVHASSYMQHFDVAKHTAYKNLRDASKTLFARQFTYDEVNENGNSTTFTSRWVSKIGYTSAEATIHLIFSPDVVPLITRLEEHFTSYEVSQVAKLSSKYSNRLYELLISWRSTGKPPFFELKTFREQLGLDSKEYAAMCDFKKYVLNRAVEQINSSTDITVSYEQHKTGRKITGFSFKFKQKSQPKVEKKIDPKRDPNTPDFFIDMTDAQRHMFSHKLAHMQETSEYAELGESHEDFAKRIADMLLEPAKFRMFYPLLERLGFK